MQLLCMREKFEESRSSSRPRALKSVLHLPLRLNVKEKVTLYPIDRAMADDYSSWK